VLIVDDILFKMPVKGVFWVLEQLRKTAEKELTDEQPVMEAILENEVAFEEGRVDRAAYEENQKALMARLREIREMKRAMAEEAAAARGEAPAQKAGPITGKATLDIGVDFGHYGPGEEKR
jgi:hypothetical protein